MSAPSLWARKPYRDWCAERPPLTFGGLPITGNSTMLLYKEGSHRDRFPLQVEPEATPNRREPVRLTMSAILEARRTVGNNVARFPLKRDLQASTEAGNCKNNRY